MKDEIMERIEKAREELVKKHGTVEAWFKTLIKLDAERRRKGTRRKPTRKLKRAAR